jgi:transposase-like protein
LMRLYIWSAVDVDSKELLALEASYGRSSLNALAFLKKAIEYVYEQATGHSR